MKFIKQFRWASFCPSVLFFLTAIFVLAMPTKYAALEISSGVLLTLSGVLVFLGFLFGNLENVVELLAGVAELAIGIWLFFPGEAPRTFMLSLGIVIVLRAGAVVYEAILSRKEDKLWICYLVVAAVFVALGIVSMANPFDLSLTLMNFTGGTALASGIVGIALLLRRGLVIREEEQSDDPRAIAYRARQNKK